MNEAELVIRLRIRNARIDFVRDFTVRKISRTVSFPFKYCLPDSSIESVFSAKLIKTFMVKDSIVNI